MENTVKKKGKVKKKKKEAKKMHQLLGVAADPCTYLPSDKFVSSSLVGVEIELEGIRRLQIEDPTFNAYWKVVDDGSLRDNGMEYVLSRPFSGIDLENALSLFDEHVAKSGYDIHLSDRCSVHVHIDIRDLTYVQLTRFVCMYTIFEDALFNIAGKSRANNIFATSFANAEGNLKILSSYGEDPGIAEVRHIFAHYTKYSACNLAAVQKFGSLEFRNHEGTYEIDRINKWINILLLMKEAAINMEIPVEEIFSTISMDGTERFFRSVFKEYSEEMMYNGLEFDMYNGLRLAQDIIYSQRLESGISVPESEEIDKSVFAVYYKKRKPKRYKERFSAFMAGKLRGSGLWEGGGMGHEALARAIEAHHVGVGRMGVAPAQPQEVRVEYELVIDNPEQEEEMEINQEVLR